MSSPAAQLPRCTERRGDDFTPVELVGPFNHPPPGIIVRRERLSAEDLVELGGLLVTNPARTAFDLARHLPRGVAVAHLDALSAATGLASADVVQLIARNKGARGVRQCQTALSLMDGGSQSPKESWLRLVLVDAGLPRPVTQIEVRELRLSIGVPRYGMGSADGGLQTRREYHGDQHRSDRTQYVKDIRRLQLVEDLGWRVVRVVNEDRPGLIVKRVHAALAARGVPTPRLPPGL